MQIHVDWKVNVTSIKNMIVVIFEISIVITIMNIINAICRSCSSSRFNLDFWKKWSTQR